MDKKRKKELLELYKDNLFNDIIPFWTKYSVDRQYGGYHHYLDRDGSLLSTDKSVWLNSRQLWTYSYLYNHFGKKKEWLDLATLGYQFLNQHCFDQDGRMFFQVTADGKPLRMRRYWLTETFGIIGLGEYAKATGDEKILQQARDMFNLVLRLYDNPVGLEPKVNPQTRPMFGHVGPMLFISSSQTMREVDPENEQRYTDTITRLFNEITTRLVKPDLKVLLEVAGINGELLDNFPGGRCIVPGHGIESAWFMMVEGLYRNDEAMIQDGLNIMNWSLERGWDKEYGGIYYMMDLKGLPSDQSTYQMKYWWPHNEALVALLLADHITGEKKYADWYEKVHEWTFSHFPDREYGEWFGYLNRDGSVNLPIKGGDWKGSFHVSRMFMYGIQLLQKN